MKEKKKKPTKKENLESLRLNIAYIRVALQDLDIKLSSNRKHDYVM